MGKLAESIQAGADAAIYTVSSHDNQPAKKKLYRPHPPDDPKDTPKYHGDFYYKGTGKSYGGSFAYNSDDTKSCRCAHSLVHLDYVSNVELSKYKRLMGDIEGKIDAFKKARSSGNRSQGIFQFQQRLRDLFVEQIQKIFARQFLHFGSKCLTESFEAIDCFCGPKGRKHELVQLDIGAKGVFMNFWPKVIPGDYSHCKDIGKGNRIHIVCDPQTYFAVCHKGKKKNYLEIIHPEIIDELPSRLVNGLTNALKRQAVDL